MNLKDPALYLIFEFKIYPAQVLDLITFCLCRDLQNTSQMKCEAKKDEILRAARVALFAINFAISDDPKSKSIIILKLVHFSLHYALL